MEHYTDLNAMETLTWDQALAVMNYVVDIHNDLATDNPQFGWVKMGSLIERLASIVRKKPKIDQAVIR